MTQRPLVVRGALVLDAGAATPVAADLLIVAGRIAEWLSPGAAAPPDAEVLDAAAHLIVPGLVNDHTHSHLSFAKGIQDRWNLELHLNAGPWTNVLFTHEERRLATLLAAAEMISKGCTAAYDLHFEIPEPTLEGMETVADAYREAGMRALIAPMVADRSIWQAIPGLLDAVAPDKPPGLATARADVDLLHAHHGIERAPCFFATSRQRLGQHARDLPGDSPLVFAPPHALSWPPFPTMAFQ